MSLLEGTLKGPWKGDFEEVEKMYSFVTSQIETERERGRERGLDKHVLTPFYGGLYLRADPLGLCRLPLGSPGQFGQSQNGFSTDSINLTTLTSDVVSLS